MVGDGFALLKVTLVGENLEVGRSIEAGSLLRNLQ